MAAPKLSEVLSLSQRNYMQTVMQSVSEFFWVHQGSRDHIKRAWKGVCLFCLTLRCLFNIEENRKRAYSFNYKILFSYTWLIHRSFENSLTQKSACSFFISVKKNSNSLPYWINFQFRWKGIIVLMQKKQTKVSAQK